MTTATDRAQRAQEILDSGTIAPTEGFWRVRSQGGDVTYTVRLAPKESCTCPDFCRRRQTCKHILATRQKAGLPHEGGNQ